MEKVLNYIVVSKASRRPDENLCRERKICSVECHLISNLWDTSFPLCKSNSFPNKLIFSQGLRAAHAHFRWNHSDSWPRSARRLAIKV